MDAAYDHIQEEVLRPEQSDGQTGSTEEGSLNSEFQEAYKSFSASPWGARLGGFLGTVKKQGETYYKGAAQEASVASEGALKGFTGFTSQLTRHVRSLSLEGPEKEAAEKELSEKSPGETADGGTATTPSLQESESLIARFRSEATKRLKDIEKAEDAADEALLKFGGNIRNFLRDAVTIAPPSDDDDQTASSSSKGKVLFESRDVDGKRVVHKTRYDAQFHAIHSSLDSFTKDPATPEYGKWKEGFDVEAKTDEIAKDLEKYTELRSAMEKLVPERVEYEEFWRRYWFLRMVVERDEERRKELLKGTSNEEEEVGWDEDSEDESSSTPQPAASETTISTTKAPSPDATAEIASSHPYESASKETPLATSTITLTSPQISIDSSALKPEDRRRSQDQHSQPDSDASYDLVSGATSRAPGSPKEERKKEEEESDEEDWE
ncbi:hypothetical protein MMC25_006197 [Agyrium rufum]|nr:hypothetical protein [Agyrium rufum]